MQFKAEVNRFSSFAGVLFPFRECLPGRPQTISVTARLHAMSGAKIVSDSLAIALE